MKIGSIIIVMLLALCSCHQGPQEPKIYLDNGVYRKIDSISGENSRSDLILYYFDGDCSMCLAKAKFISGEAASGKIKLKPFFIAKTLNAPALLYNWKAMKIASAVYIEKNNEFDKYLPFMKVSKIGADRSLQSYDEQINPENK